MSEVVKKRFLSMGQTFKLRDYLVENWASIEQEKFNAVAVSERASIHLQFSVSEYSVRAVVKELGKTWPGRTKDKKWSDRPKRLARYLRAVVKAIDQIEESLGTKFLNGAVDREDLEQLCKGVNTKTTDKPAD